MNNNKQQRLARKGQIVELKQQLKKLETRIKAAASSIGSALFYLTGGVKDMKIEVARDHFEQLEKAHEQYKQVGGQLQELEDED